MLAGDAAFDDAQVAHGTVPGICERRAALLETYARIRAWQRIRPTTILYTHDPMNRAKLAGLAIAEQAGAADGHMAPPRDNG